MPADFDRCVKNGGRVRTVDLDGDRYVRYCFIGGKSYRGHTKKKKTNKGK